MRLSRYFLPLLKETPKEAEIVSHQLMLRAGMIKQQAAGSYSWLPLGLKVLNKIVRIVEEEQNRSGAIQLLMPTLQSADLWRESGRYDAYGKEMLRLQDRHERDMLYGPTNEEMITDIFRTYVRSYKDLPLNLYHIQWKFRDEVRPRFGTMRSREFLMKDAYSFDLDREGATRAFYRMFAAYLRTFHRMGLTAVPMRADSGPIGGDLSYEFIILAETGESAVFCHADLLKKPIPAIDTDFRGDLDPIFKDWTSLYAATEEMVDHAKFEAEVPADKRMSARGIEVGHIFYFGTKYSHPMKAVVSGPDGKEIEVHMGSYGIGPTRLVPAVIEASHDDAGIIWPVSVAPFEASVINLKVGDAESDAAADDFYVGLQRAGIDVLLDDRDQPAGAKFAAADLTGVPYHLIVGPRGLKTGEVEIKHRKTGQRETLPLGSAIDRLKALIEPGEAGHGLTVSTGQLAAQQTRPFSRFEFMIAGRYLRARRKDAFISVIAALTLAGVAIGVATLIVVMSVMNGFRAELLTKILGLNGHFSAYPIERQFTDYNDVVKGIELVPGVTHAVAFVEGQALASGQTESTGVSVRGMDLASIKKLPLLYTSNKQGGWEGWDQSQGVALGYRLAQKLGVGLGDPVTIINPKGAMTPFGTTPNIRSYPVTVIFDLGMVEFDSFYIYMPLKAAQTYFQMYQDVLKPGMKNPGPDATDEQIDAAYQRQYQATGIEIFINDPDDIDNMRAKLQSGAARPLVLTDWQQRNETFFSALQVERVVMFTILSMIVVVAAFNIISSLVMLVKDKGADIAVLRTMGATRGSIMRIFCMTGTAIGITGTVIGFALGLTIAANAETLRAFVSNLIGVRIFPPEVFFLSALPSKVDPVEVTIIVCIALGLSFLATLYPAWRAARYDPVEALRYE